MDVKSIFESNALSGFNFQVTGAPRFLLEVLDTKGVGCKQTVVAHVPPGRVPWVPWMVENGDANGLAFNRARVITPRGLLAPGIFPGDARAQHNIPGGLALVGLVWRETHRFREANGHRSLFRVAKNDFFVAGMNRYFKVKKPLVFGPRIDPEQSFIRAGDRSIRSDPFVGGANNARVFVGLHIQELVVDDRARLRCFRPKINAIY